MFSPGSLDGTGKVLHFYVVLLRQRYLFLCPGVVYRLDATKLEREGSEILTLFI